MSVRSSLFTALFAACFGVSAFAAMPPDQGVPVRVNAISSNLSQKSVRAGVNLNTADASALVHELEVIGSKRAQAIIAHRAKNGPFKSIEDLSDVTGIGKRIIEKNRGKIIIG